VRKNESVKKRKKLTNIMGILTKKYTMKLNLIIMSMACCLFFSPTIYGQNTAINGSVVSDMGDTLVGAKIVVKDMPGVGTITNFSGKYNLKVAATTPLTVVVSYVGFSSFEQVIEKSGTYNFELRQDALSFDDIIVTGVVNGKSKLSSSVSITTLKPEGIAQSAPRTTAEIFRTIPGIRAESSGGDGNTNIAVRGVPISSGGSKYLQLQEDGLPVLMFGDIAFATSDIFLRADANLARIEAIRGGSASTLASNAPAGIINFISKTGNVQGGSFAQTLGVDFNSYRSDFEYGSPLGNGVSFHVGGFVRTGEGPRTAGYTANQGGQVKANLTKAFENGYARIYFKHLNDRAAAYMPNPIQVTGTNANPTWSSAPGFSANQGALQSPYLQSNFGTGVNGERRRVDVADGMHPKSTSVGAEFSFDLGNDWKITSRSRFTSNSGRFVAPFTAAVGATGDIVNTVGDALERDLTGAALSYADDGSAFNGDLAQIIHMFDTELQNFNNFFSDSKLSKTLLNKKMIVTAGYFKGYQRINMSWLWNSYLMEVNGQDGRLIDITAADSLQTPVSVGGQYAYGTPLWGNLHVQYNATYDISAPYATVEYNVLDNLNVDASFRYDMGRVRGVGAGGGSSVMDVNNDGTISAIEENVNSIDLAQKNAVNYNYQYASYSAGANYQFNSKQAIFTRYSLGYAAKGDRAIFPTDSYTSLGNPKDQLQQIELGWKQKFNRGAIFATAFYSATAEEGGFEASTQTVIENDYRAAGIEIEGGYGIKGFDIRGAVTYTLATIASGDNKGNAPRRQPPLMFNIIPSYTYKAHSIGVSIIGQSDAYAQDNNDLVMPGYFVTNAFVNFGIRKGLTFSVNGNNLLNAIGITESEEGSITNNQVNYVRARSISGRSISCTLRYNF